MMTEFHRERQTVHWGFRALIAAVTIPYIVGVVAGLLHKGEPIPPLGWLGLGLGGLGLAVAWAFMSGISTSVTQEGVVVTFGAFNWPRWTFDRKRILSYRVVTFSPLRDFGGWGIRYGSGNRMCINSSGNRGVEFTLRNAKRSYIIGSDNPEALAQAVRMVTGIAPAKG